jgi:excisionase family DNA binding protein
MPQSGITHSTTDAPFWLTVPEVAARLRASRRSVYRAIKKGKLRAAVINGRGDLRSCDEWVREWLTSRAV